jgi:hypothetical protein
LEFSRTPGQNELRNEFGQFQRRAQKLHILVQQELESVRRISEFEGNIRRQPAASASGIHIESALAYRIPFALTPAPQTVHRLAPTGIEQLDAILQVVLGTTFTVALAQIVRAHLRIRLL